VFLCVNVVVSVLHIIQQGIIMYVGPCSLISSTEAIYSKMQKVKTQIKTERTAQNETIA